MDRVHDFLIRHKLSPDSFDSEELLGRFILEMERGLEGKSSSLQMIPTYIRLGKRVKKGDRAIVLDAGGTNFRTCLVEIGENGEFEISDFKKVSMPGIDREVSKAEFFSILADNVERLIDKADKIGFCFSYAARITEDHDGIPLSFSKEIKAREVLGERLGKSLLEELERRGHNIENKKIAILNDTVATLLAAKALYPEHASGYIGFILGTGTNTAYLEDEGNIKTINGERGIKEVINVESGALRFELGDLDEVFLKGTKDPFSYHLEKMISGAYLGSFATLVIEKAIEEGLLSKTFADRFHTIERLNTTRMSHYLEMPFNRDYDLVKCVEGSDEDADNLYLILKNIVERAAKLTAVNLSAAILKSDEGKTPREPIVINADGTTFYKTEFLEFYTKVYLTELLSGDRERFFKIVRIDNSPVLGASIAGMSL